MKDSKKTPDVSREEVLSNIKRLRKGHEILDTRKKLDRRACRTGNWKRFSNAA